MTDRYYLVDGSRRYIGADEGTITPPCNAGDIIVQWSDVSVEDGMLLDVVRGDPARCATELAAHLGCSEDACADLAREVARLA